MQGAFYSRANFPAPTVLAVNEERMLTGGRSGFADLCPRGCDDELFDALNFNLHALDAVNVGTSGADLFKVAFKIEGNSHFGGPRCEEAADFEFAGRTFLLRTFQSHWPHP